MSGKSMNLLESKSETSLFGVLAFFTGTSVISSGFVILLLKILFFLTLLLTLYVIYLRAINTISERRRKTQIERWEPILLDYINGAEISRKAEHQIKRGDRDLLGEILIEYSQDIRGQALEKMVELWKRLGFDKFSVKRLKSRSVWRRAYGATMLGIMRDTSATPLLVDLLKDKSPIVTFAAARSLARIGAKKELNCIIETITKSKSWSEDQFAEIVLDFGQDIAEDLVNLCEDKNVPLSRLAFIIDVLGFIRYQPAYQVLTKLAEKGERETRIRSIKAIGELSRPESLSFLLKIFKDESWEIRCQVAKAVGKIGDEKAIPELVKVLDDEVWWVRYNAAVALAKLGEEGLSALWSVAEGTGSDKARKVAQHIFEQRAYYAESHAV